ncbi:MAG TPA: class F sortase [Solirubrobacteraceae bacterium]|nr:class F sortase [Solirubrobacteraceae bacterium]
MTRGRTLATLLGVAALLIGIVLLAAVAGAFAVSRCDGGGEARTGELAMRADPVSNQARGTTVPRARRPARPVRVEIPSIGVDASIVPLGLNTDRTLQVPSDFGDAGWWTGGPRPGEPGAAIIAGHVDSYTGPAVFFRLGELGLGAEIVVVRRDGTRGRFRVVGREQYPKDEFPTERVYGRTSDPALRLITCSGTFDRSSGHYLDNTVVYALSA